MNSGTIRKAAIKAAREKWEGAPAHVKIMAAAYVGPIFTAIEAMGAELDAINIDIEVIAQALPLEEPTKGN